MRKQSRHIDKCALFDEKYMKKYGQHIIFLHFCIKDFRQLWILTKRLKKASRETLRKKLLYDWNNTAVYLKLKLKLKSLEKCDSVQTQY